MLIKLIQIQNEQEMAKALSSPVVMQDRALYVTEQPAFAERLAKHKLPCIFVEQEPCQVYGVDMIIAQSVETDGEKSEEPVWQQDGGARAQEDAWRQDGVFLERIWRRHYRLPWTIAETKRLLIRESVSSDLPDFLELYAQEAANPDVRPFSAQPQEELTAYIQNRYQWYGYGLWTVTEKAGGKVVGRMGFEEGEPPAEHVPCLGYAIKKEYRRQGYAREAALALLTYAKEELEFDRIGLYTSPANIASRRLAESLGFVLTGGKELLGYRLKL